MSDSNDPMAEIRASFFVECEELLETLQDGLQALEEGTGDLETINVVFRAVHSIKGGAGAFGLEALVRFAHRFETVLDEVRAGRLSPDHNALKVFFQCADHLSDLVRISREAGPQPSQETAQLLASLDVLLGENSASADGDHDEQDIDFQPAALTLNFDDQEPEDDGTGDTPSKSDNAFTIYFKPENELFETGNEPFMAFRALEELGECTIACDTHSLPDLADLATETAYLSWTIDLCTEAEEAEVTAVFEFFEGLCTLQIEQQAISGASNSVPGDMWDHETPSQDTIVAETENNSASAQSETLKAPIANLKEAAKRGTSQQKALQTSINVSSTSRPDASAAPVAPAKSVVRVDLDRIERLVNLVGELVINQAMLSQSLECSGLSPHSDAMNGLEEFQRLTRDIQDSVMMIRAQPVKSLFQRMSRIVREASAAVDKDVRLHTEGESTEVDKTVIERLADPLTHMIRNAVDHGLETPEQRRAMGKPEQGRVNLSAAHRSGRVVIDVSDDGAGIDRPMVLQIAIDKGLIPADSTLSDTEIDNLLFLPGFSTAPIVSDLSGRGVGMDVVKTAIQALGGRIAISSIPGEGTTFSISLPLTLAMLDGMVVQVAEETLVLPLNVVVETLALSQNDVEMVRPGVSVVRVRSGFAPLFDLGKELGYRDALTNYDGSVVLLIAHEDGSHAALVIDSIQDQRQVVIKGLDDGFYRAPGIAAATILGDGQIALILDASDIISHAVAANSTITSNAMIGVSA